MMETTYKPTLKVSDSHIEQAFIANPVLVKQITGRYDIPDEEFEAIFKQHPQGNRITVLVDPFPEQIGTIIVPDEVKRFTPVGAGLVVAAGPLAGQGVPYPGGPICHPSQLLYRHVSFGDATGRSLRLSIRATRYMSAVLIMCDRDILTIDWDDEPYTGDIAS
jgi:hypothetical protein